MTEKCKNCGKVLTKNTPNGKWAHRTPFAKCDKPEPRDEK